MKIGIDLSSIDKSSINQGVYSYSIGLARGFHEIDKKNFYQIYVNKNLKNHLKNKIKFKNFKIIEIKNNSSILKKITTTINLVFGFIGINTYWIHSNLINIINSENKKIFEKNSDFMIFLNAHETVYNLSIKSIINFHDIMHKSHPEYLKKKEIIMRNIVYHNSANSSNYIIASSKSMKNEFINFMKIKKNKIVQISEGVEKISNSKIKNKKKKNKYFFYPAQFWEHKNHIQLIEEFQKFKLKNKNNVKLYLCGKKKNFYEKIKKFIKIHNIKDVVYLGTLSANNLKRYYLNCEAVVMPSRYESSSLVILEGISNRKIIIASDIGPNKELLNNFKLYLFDLNKKNDLSYKFNEVLNLNSHKKKKIINHNLAKIDKYLWKNIALEYYKLLNEKLTKKND